MNAVNTTDTTPRTARATGGRDGGARPADARDPGGIGQRVLERIVEVLARQAAEEYLRGRQGSG